MTVCYASVMTPRPSESALSRRERVRAATIEEIKATAARMLRERGSDLRFADIARDMGMTAPALYRYFSDRDELLSALMVDGFAALQDAFNTALDAAPPDDVAARLRVAAHAYRDFAREDPSRFSLMFGLPNPGFAHDHHSSGPAAGATLATLEGVLRAALEHESLPPPLIRDVGPVVATELPTVQQSEGDPIPAEHYQALLHFLAAVHGFACLESFAHLSWISDEARDEIFAAEIDLLLAAMAAPDRR